MAADEAVCVGLPSLVSLLVELLPTGIDSFEFEGIEPGFDGVGCVGGLDDATLVVGVG